MTFSKLGSTWLFGEFKFSWFFINHSFLSEWWDYNWNKFNLTLLNALFKTFNFSLFSINLTLNSTKFYINMCLIKFDLSEFNTFLLDLMINKCIQNYSKPLSSIKNVSTVFYQKQTAASTENNPRRILKFTSIWLFIELFQLHQFWLDWNKNKFWWPLKIQNIWHQATIDTLYQLSTDFLHFKLQILKKCTHDIQAISDFLH